ncbi:Prolipoprotein diacylglyceryl transferase [Oceanicola granulosus HTCC2516]|uniref:Phosphatidylglycerol--prolipoprotein diacylglyceryl transferase n=1 Tax=Oceanicola granulosus (strain ATCC BAA-861 / DSM 15982 / KCTC 12143 / HTCC2516) TaxID=314256 RepID=Q2CAU6_OCEGH|nr:prolipoprotein diacylglyceryl transferase [Oceanicola granulosus]EAR49785.1 Prolipoprotein diacylglyceryl transferase [Oceanicola granulosus HTCC2516]
MTGIPFPEFLRPEIFSVSLFGLEFALRWYALAYIVGIVIGWRIILAAVRRPRLFPDNVAPLTREQVEDLVTWMIVGIIVGGRLGFVLFYRPGHFLDNPLEIPAIWQGGMSFHGGFLGVGAAIVYVARKNGARIGTISDLLGIAVPPGLFLGRLANFVNGELWGRPTDLPWGVIFPGEAAQTCADAVAGACARHPSQLYEALLEGLLLGAVLLVGAFRLGWLKLPWLVTGVFLVGYGLSRMLVELVRQADAQFVGPGNPWGHVIQFGEWGLTMGQLLSLPMVIVGIAMIHHARRQRAAAP